MTIPPGGPPLEPPMMPPPMPEEPPPPPPDPIDPNAPGEAMLALTGEVPDIDLVVGDDEPEIDEGAVRGEQALPGERDDLIDLSDSDENELLHDLMQLIDLYDTSQKGRNDREQEIESYYSLSDEPTHGGTTSDAEHLSSEMTMSQVDQAVARLIENVMNTKPLMQVDPIVKTNDPDAMKIAKELAASTERFLNSFAINDMRLDRKLPIAILRACKVGTAVLHPQWVRRERYEHFWGEDGKEKTIDDEQGGVDVEIPPNKNMIVWPPTVECWQDAAIVGHRTFMSKSEWRDYGKNTLDLSLDDIEDAEMPGKQSTDEGRRGQGSRPDREQQYFGIKKDEQLEDKVGHIQVTQLYTTMALPGKFKPQKLHIILSEPLRKIWFISENRHHKQRIPYFPIRYKQVDDMAWGLGLGDEVVYCQAADSAMRNLQMDNLMSGAYHIVQVKAGTMADVLLDRPLPGQVVPTDNPGEDLVVTPMGGKAEGLEEAVADNRFRAREASGLAPVLGGMGDPIQKSGTGTGATGMLIEQAGKKFGHIDRTIRNDFDEFANFILEMVTQYATDGLFYRWVSDEDARVIELLKYEPLRGPVDENFKVVVQAPNASTSREGRKSTYMTLWQFINQHFQMVLELGEPVMTVTNPTGWERYKEQVFQYMDSVARTVVEHQDLPGLADEMPDFPEPTTQDQQMQQLMQQMQEMQMQMEQMQQMAEQAPPPGMEGAPAGMPPGMEGGAPPGPPGGMPQ